MSASLAPRAARLLLLLCALPQTALATPISIGSKFNSTSIPADGRFIWFNAHLTSFPNEAGSLFFSGLQVFVNDPTAGEDRTYSIPNALITFLTGAGTQATSFSSALNRWETTIYLGSAHNDPFFAGLALQPTVNHRSSNPVTWSGEVITPSANFLGDNFQWQWSAAVYTSFSTDYNALGVTAVDGAGASQSGTPLNYTGFVVGGARGGGGSNFTGSNSATGSFVPTFDTVPAPVPEPSTLLLVSLGFAVALVRRRVD